MMTDERHIIKPIIMQRRRRHCHTLFIIILLLYVPLMLRLTIVVSSSLEEKNEGGGDEESKSQAVEEKQKNDDMEDDDDDANNATTTLIDQLDDGIFDAVSPDPDCQLQVLLFDDNENNQSTRMIEHNDCWHPPASTIDDDDDDDDTDIHQEKEKKDETVVAHSASTAVCSNNETRMEESFFNISQNRQPQQQDVCVSSTSIDSSSSKKSHSAHAKTDKHWGSDPAILQMRDTLRGTATSTTTNTSSSSYPNNIHPPIFLLPGLASTRLVAWKYTSCPASLSPLLPVVHDIKVQDVVWLNLQLLLRTPVDMECLKQCLQLDARTQDDDGKFCKLRPDEGLDAISSLAPGGLGSHLLVGGTNTVYAWLIQWLSDHLGYDVTTLHGLPYDWRLSPHKMQQRDGFMTWMRRTMETAVQVNQQPGIMVAHSMGNLIFRYFLEWLRQELRHETYQHFVQQRNLERKRQRQRRRRRIQLKRNKKVVQPHHPILIIPSTVLQGDDDDRDEEEEEEDDDPDDVNDNNDRDDMTKTGSTNNSSATSNVWLGGWMSSSSSSTAAAAEQKQPQTPWTRNTATSNNNDNPTSHPTSTSHHHTRQNQAAADLWELAEMEGDELWYKWMETHIWTYVGLSAPMLGAVNPLRAVISGENMGLPISDEVARVMELSKCKINKVLYDSIGEILSAKLYSIQTLALFGLLTYPSASILLLFL